MGWAKDIFSFDKFFNIKCSRILYTWFNGKISQKLQVYAYDPYHKVKWKVTFTT